VERGEEAIQFFQVHGAVELHLVQQFAEEHQLGVGQAVRKLLVFFERIHGMQF
jgi:hypothetical protein